MALTVFNPNLDLFAHMQNKKFEKFLSWKPCMGATHVDMFTLDWKHLNAFLFLPFFCISSVVKKCLDNQIKHLCGVFPLWKTKSCWPNLMWLAGNKYTVLKLSSKLLVPALSSNIKASNVSETCLDFCKFVSKLLQVKHVRKEQADFVTHNVWRDATLKDKKSTLRL